MTYRTPIFNKTFEYNIKDVEIENHFDRNNWGPKLWDILHTFSYNYDENPNIQQKQNAMNFFSSICLLLPCDFCKQHCRSFIFNNPPKINFKSNLNDIHSRIIIREAANSPMQSLSTHTAHVPAFFILS